MCYLDSRDTRGAGSWTQADPSPVSEMLQFKDVHSLRVAGSTEELGIHAEHQGADVHIPRAKARQHWSLHGILVKGNCSILLTKRMGRKDTHTGCGAPCPSAAEPVG